MMLGVSGHEQIPAEALEHAGPAALYAVLIGVPVGAVTGFALRRSVTAGWTEVSSIRIAMVLVPLSPTLSLWESAATASSPRSSRESPTSSGAWATATCTLTSRTPSCPPSTTSA
ncbi:hypothetical protein GCM10010411_22320 [Actinomadura fulvescens]|uniref:Uncharacterized protein n=1 Tax=Actinomadura fulvescens TaxID=46160 RepID=A0ABP6BYD8_9ACTN